MRAALIMYDLPEIRPWIRLWWAAIRHEMAAHGVPGAPKRPSFDFTDEAIWHEPGMFLFQTCGYPLIAGLTGPVEVLGTPGYRAAGCAGARYRSLILVRGDSPAERLADLRGLRLGYNERHSHSGYNALRAAIAPLANGTPFFGSARRLDGGHEGVIARLRAGRIDCCAVDCVTVALLQRYRPEALGRARVLALTASAPGLPYVTRPGGGARRARMRAALVAAFENPDYAEARDALLLDSFRVTNRSTYRVIAEREARARALGYSELA